MQHPADSRFAEVQALLAEYYDALYRGDDRRLRRVFHPEAHYYTASGGSFLHWDMPTYLPIVAERASPESLGEPYDYAVDSIEFAGPLCAVVRLRCVLLSKRFIDHLTLMKVEGSWQVVSKVFHFDELKQQN